MNPEDGSYPVRGAPSGAYWTKVQLRMRPGSVILSAKHENSWSRGHPRIGFTDCGEFGISLQSPTGLPPDRPRY